MLHDNEGDNISKKIKATVKLTAQYWAWKNEEADYYGFFITGRYFSFDSELNRDERMGNIAYDRITEDVIDELRLQPEVMKDLITKYDVISVKGRRYPRIKEDGVLMDVYHEYGAVPFQHREDLDITLQVLEEKYPEFKAIAQSYMKSSIAHDVQYVHHEKEVYHAYCEWLFDILFEVETRIDTTWYSVEEYRVMGYLAERLCGIYYMYLKQKEGIRSFELPKTLFHDTTPKLVFKILYLKKVFRLSYLQIINLLHIWM